MRRCRRATRWVPAALWSPGQSRRKHKQPWEEERFPVEQGDRLQLGEQEGAGLVAAAPPAPVITWDGGWSPAGSQAQSRAP